MMGLFFTHTPFVVIHAINATPPERLQQYHAIPHLFWTKVKVAPDFGVHFQVNYAPFLKIQPTFLQCINSKSFVETNVPFSFACNGKMDTA